MRVFIGASSKYLEQPGLKKCNNDYIIKIIDRLKNEGFDVEPWWEAGVLPNNKHFLDVLIEKSKQCDAGIFIINNDEDGERNKKASTKKKQKFPVGNVILEAGMFFSAKGKHKTFLILDGNYSNFIIPSDIAGYKIPKLQDRNLPETIVHFLREERKEEVYDKFTFYFNERMLQSILEKKFTDWKTKALYVGTESARLWNSIEYQDNRLTGEEATYVTRFFSAIKKKNSIKKIDNVISFGPGCGLADKDVLSRLFQYNNTLKYVPIDINSSLAYKTSEMLDNEFPDLTIPFIIVDDFEVHYKNIKRIISTEFDYRYNTNFYMMLGGTFANLEGTEDKIIRKIKTWMNRNDFFLLDTFVKKDDYKFKDDNDRQPKELPDSYIALFRNAIVRHLVHGSQKGLNDASLQSLSEFKNAITAEEDEVYKNIYTNINGTSVVTYKYQLSEDTRAKIFLVAKRYKFDELKVFLEEHFEIVDSFNGLDEHPEKLTTRAIFLLKKRQI